MGICAMWNINMLEVWANREKQTLSLGELLGEEGGLVGFYGISTTVGHLMQNTVYKYISNMYDS